MHAIKRRASSISCCLAALVLGLCVHNSRMPPKPATHQLADLRNAITSAPKFGLNGRALLLEAARMAAQDDSDDEAVTGERLSIRTRLLSHLLVRGRYRLQGIHSFSLTLLYSSAEPAAAAAEPSSKQHQRLQGGPAQARAAASPASAQPTPASNWNCECQGSCTLLHFML